MIVKRFYDAKLAQTSYLIGCGRSGTAVVIDANRDAEQYVRAAAAEEVRITDVTETHIHADFVSGSRELAQLTGATLRLSDEGTADWKYAYAAEAGAVLLHDGDHFMVGNVRITVVHTPGHTPEHVSFLVTDTAAANEPIAIVTGDFVFVGDVGRPDLLERAAKVQGSMDGAARTLFRSIARFKTLPDWMQVWPGHGAGSACGKGLSAVPHSTVGYERLFNWALSITSEDEFVRTVLDGQPEPPVYFAEMKRINKQGPAILGGFTRPPRQRGQALGALLDGGALIIDTRSAVAFASGHVPGTINIPLDKSFTTWAGWLIPYTRDFYLIIDDRPSERVEEAIRDLAMIGLDRVAGWFGRDAIEAWPSDGRALEPVAQISALNAAARIARGEVEVLDVRGQTEWESGHVADAQHIPLGYLGDRRAELPRGKPIVVHCEAGARSAIAASLLQAAGVPNVINMTGGFEAWRGARLPVETGARAAAYAGVR